MARGAAGASAAPRRRALRGLAPRRPAIGALRVAGMLLGAGMLLAGPGVAAPAATPATPAPASAPADDDALNLADALPESTAQPAPWRGHAEVATGRLRVDALGGRAGAAAQTRRVSLAVQAQGRPAPAWQATAAARLDLDDPAQRGHGHAILSLQEASLGWQPQPEQLLELGRIRVQPGLSLGYNPSDFWRAGTLRSVVTADPAALKTHRLGHVALRGQWLWDGGAFAAHFSPRLARHPSASAFSPDFGATNDRQRWLLSLSQRLRPGLQPQLLLAGAAGAPVQLGFNVSGLLGEATIVHLEAAAGRGRSQQAQALGLPEPARGQTRATLGLSHTTPHKVTLTLEASFDGAAPARADWRALREGPAAPYLAYRGWVAHAQELPTRRQVLAHLRWADALVPRLDLAALLQHAVEDRSRLAWFEARYRFERADLFVQAQATHGAPRSVFAPLPRGGSVGVRGFF